MWKLVLIYLTLEIFDTTQSERRMPNKYQNESPEWDPTQERRTLYTYIPPPHLRQERKDMTDDRHNPSIVNFGKFHRDLRRHDQEDDGDRQHWRERDSDPYPPRRSSIPLRDLHPIHSSSSNSESKRYPYPSRDRQYDILDSGHRTSPRRRDPSAEVDRFDRRDPYDRRESYDRNRDRDDMDRRGNDRHRDDMDRRDSFDRNRDRDEMDRKRDRDDMDRKRDRDDMDRKRDRDEMDRRESFDRKREERDREVDRDDDRPPKRHLGTFQFVATSLPTKPSHVAERPPMRRDDRDRHEMETDRHHGIPREDGDSVEKMRRSGPMNENQDKDSLTVPRTIADELRAKVMRERSKSPSFPIEQQAEVLGRDTGHELEKDEPVTFDSKWLRHHAKQPAITF